MDPQRGKGQKREQQQQQHRKEEAERYRSLVLWVVFQFISLSCVVAAADEAAVNSNFDSVLANAKDWPPEDVDGGRKAAGGGESGFMCMCNVTCEDGINLGGKGEC